MSPDAKEFFAAYDSQIRFQDKDEQAATIERLSEVPAIAGAWAQSRRHLFGTVHFIKESGRFRMFAEGNLGKGDFNVYRMFVELALTVSRNGGRAAQLVPEGIYNGANCAAIRLALFEECKLELLVGFENAREVWFKEVHSALKFALYSAVVGSTTDSFVCGFNVRTEARLAELRAGAGIRVPVSVVREFSPDAVAIMELGDQRDIDIATKMYSRCPKFGDEAAGPPYRHYMRELDMGTDREFFGESIDGLPLYEGRMVSQFDHRAKGYRSGRGRAAVWEDLEFGSAVKSIQPQWRLSPSDVPEKVVPRMAHYRIGFCDVTGPTNERSLIAALIPAGCPAGHTVPTIIFGNDQQWQYMVWLAVANSFAADWLVRQKVQLHLAYSILDTLPVPRLQRTDPIARELVTRALLLTCCGPEMTDYWNAMAADGWCDPGPVDGLPPGVEDEGGRLRLRAEIDAIVARDVYGLTPAEVGYILDTFPIVREREVKRFGEFRTGRLILEAYCIGVIGDL
jgi:hypothetical protein